MDLKLQTPDLVKAGQYALEQSLVAQAAFDSRKLKRDLAFEIAKEGRYHLYYHVRKHLKNGQWLARGLSRPYILKPMKLSEFSVLHTPADIAFKLLEEGGVRKGVHAIPLVVFEGISQRRLKRELPRPGDFSDHYVTSPLKDGKAFTYSQNFLIAVFIENPKYKGHAIEPRKLWSKSFDRYYAKALKRSLKSPPRRS